MLWENANVAQYLEGTGVLIFDRLRKMVRYLMIFVEDS